MLLAADARALPLLDKSVYCVVTSPPYFRQRDYGHARQIGQEATPEAYVAALVGVFNEVRRVLRDDGTLWLNLGDSYAQQGGRHDGRKDNQRGVGARRTHEAGAWDKGPRVPPQGLKAKDLIGIPWAVAFALRSSGWYLRRDIIWHAPNKLPESVKDRPALAHEYVFLMSKSQRYRYDADAVAVPASDAMLVEVEAGYDGAATKEYAAAGAQNPSETKRRIIANARKRADRFGGNKHSGGTSKHLDGSVYTGRPMVNLRTVWRINCRAFSGQHFATFPDALAETCILAGCPQGGVVLDPFFGSGTVGRVAERLGRRRVGVDLGYHDIARERTAQKAFAW